MKKKLHQLFHSYNNRHFLSRWVRFFAERHSFAQGVGILIGIVTFFTGIVIPNANFAISYAATEFLASGNSAIEIPTTTESTFTWSLTRYGLSQQFSLYHPGIDLTAPLGTPVYAAANGIVTEAGNSLWGYGKSVVVDHGNNMYSRYAHLSEILVTKNQTIARGEGIGRVGATGWATGYHLHFEVLFNNLPVNPLDLLPKQ